MSPRANRRARERALKREETRRNRVARRAGVGAASAVVGTALIAPSAEAATFTVTNLNDAGAGSLRQAVSDANAAAGDDDVLFQSGLSGTITLTSGEIDVTDDGLDIQGPGASQLTVSGNNASRIFDLYGFNTGSETVRIAGLTLTAANSGPANDGGAINSRPTGGSTADLTLENMTLTDNAAGDSGGGVASAGDAGGATLTIRSSLISGNDADPTGNGDGGGVYALASGLDIAGTTVSNNQAGHDGGGVYFFGALPNGAGMTISDSTISGNYAKGRGGGGITAFEWRSPLEIQNTTMSANGTDDRGGGIYLYTDEDQPTAIRNSTIVGNSAVRTGGGIYRYGADNAAGGPDEVTISSTIVADNTAPDGDLGDQVSSGAQPSVDGTFVLGFSLIESGGAATSESPAGSNILATDPQLGTLAANGGPTQTHLPALGSPVIDAGIANSLTTDQRNYPRPADLGATPNRPGSDGTDIGAVEIRGGACQGVVAFSEFNQTDGDDTLTGTEGADLIVSLAGNDTVRAGGGNDCVNGDDGNDKLRGQGANDDVKGLAGKDNASGGGGKDKVSGGDGNDSVKGGGGKDKLKGNAGKDKLSARDGEKDKINCGAGKDKATVDEEDKVAANCETVKAK